ncbi:hypothetical protein BT96DRAFT_1017773 [Gymnopus androsaceus JB14]|uniref:F-box domain-containing protein n=1 Tax=Gymnopus androsaceus JB14 TaxID=1447944 RepID=A0A6A4HYD4_9AGAR|nr:hypothetical protein BT96DRAFT_1017773 [Gymnopus androsaceus JB14]
MPVEPLPNELLECILNHLYLPRQTYSFQLLCPPNSMDEAERYQDFLDANDRLLALFDSNPRLATYVRSLEINDFRYATLPLHMSTAGIVQRLYNLNEISFSLIRWTWLPLWLKNLLMLSKRLHLPDLRSGCSSLMNSVNWCLCCAKRKHLKSLEVIDISTALLSGGLATSPLHCRLGPDRLPEWLLEDSCPFEVGRLQSLRIQHDQHDHPRIASLLQQAGASLGELELQDLYQRTIRQPSNVVHLGYIPNLHTLKLVNLHQSDTYTPVPWILSLFEPLLNGNQSPPRHLVIELSSEHDDPVATPQWEHWVAFDAFFARAEFALLETVDIIMTSRVNGIPGDVPSNVADLLSRRLGILKESGKLRVIH